MQDNTGKTYYSYDKSTQLLTMVTYPDGKSSSFSYDNQSNRTQMIDPFGKVTAYGYDSRNRLTGVGPALNNWDASYSYKDNDVLETVQLSNGMTSTNSSDGANLTGLIQTKSSGVTMNTFNYMYDNNGNQKSKPENSAPNTFVCDKLIRIWTSSWLNETHAYDAGGTGNRCKTRKRAFIVPRCVRRRSRLIRRTRTMGKSCQSV